MKEQTAGKFSTEVRLSREMGLLDATMIGVGAMIGAGIFVLIGIAAGVAGPALIITFVLNGLVAFLTAMSYAELGSCFHDAGGGYLWVKEGLPGWNGFLSGWMSWFAHAVACSLYAIGFGAYFEHVCRELGIGIPHWVFLSPQKILAAGVAVFFGYINFRGASETGKVGNLVTIGKIIILFVFIGFGLEIMFSRQDWLSSFSPFMPHGWGGIFKAMGLTFIAFQGFEVIAQSSEEIRNPRKNIPRAVFLSLAIVVPIYLMVAVSALGAIRPGAMSPWDYLSSHKELALVEVARRFFPGGGVMILAGGLISTMSALNATVYSSSRVAFAMGRDRNFPAFFSRVHPKRFTPHLAILISLIMVVFMAVSLPVEDVASAADVMFLLLFFQVNLAMIGLRRKRPDLDRGFLVPLCPYLSIAGIVMLLFLAFYMFTYSPTAVALTGAWVVTGLAVYKGYASHREIKHIEKTEALERIEQKDYRILACLSGVPLSKGLVDTAFAIAKKHSAEIIFLHVMEVHEGQKLVAKLANVGEIPPVLKEAESRASRAGIPSRSIVKVSHRISQGIVDTASEEKCNFIVMGRHQNMSLVERSFSSLMDSVLSESPSEIAVLNGDLGERPVRNIMVPFRANVHSRLALEIAPALAEYFDADLNVVFVFDDILAEAEQTDTVREIRETIRGQGMRATLEVIRGESVLETIVEKSKEIDLIVMGARTGDLVELLFGKSLTGEITDRVGCPVLWLKEYEERPSFWSSVIRPQLMERKNNER